MLTKPSASTGTVKKPTLTEQVRNLQEAVTAAVDDRDRLGEALSQAVAMLRQEDVGWATVGAEAHAGLNLDDLKKWSKEIRTSMTGTKDKAPNPHMRNGFMLRYGYVWDGDIQYDKVGGVDAQGNPRDASTRGKANVDNIIKNALNQRLFFGSSARRRREMALFADGCYFVVGDRKTPNSTTSSTLRPVPLVEITQVHTDPEFGEVIAYRWTKPDLPAADGTPASGKPESERSTWVYVDWWDEPKPTHIKYNGAEEVVSQTAVMFDLLPNRPEGYRFGSPDAIAAVVWARVIRDLIMNGVKMQDALAMFAFTVTAESASGQKAVAMELGRPTMGGSAAAGAGNTELKPLSSAGSGYNFDSLRFVVSTMAASLHISGIALSADTAFAGSSYGAAKTLDLPTRLAMQSRRAEHIEFDQRVLAWLGARDAVVWFPTYDDETAIYRATQAAMLAWTTGTLTPEAFRAELERIFGHSLSGEIPKGVIVPNNQKQIDDAAKQAATLAASKQAASPDQGQNKGTGETSRDADME